MLKKKFRIFLVSVLLIILALKLLSNFDTVAHQFCKYEVNNSLNFVLSKKILDFSYEQRETQKQLCTYHLTGDKITGINVDSYSVSIISAKLTNMLVQAVSNFGNDSFGIPLGNITGLMTLSGKGPKIKIKTVPLGNIACDTESQFVSAGINQTLFRLVLKINMAYEVLAPFTRESGEFSFTYTLCETIIVGDVPRLYLND